MLSWLHPAMAQQMSIRNFSKMKKRLLGHKTFETDKTQATLDLLTSEKGFTFKANGKEDVTATEGDDMITLLLPHRTRSLTIKHPEYGELQWKVPAKVKALKKKKRYTCTLLTLSNKKEYHIGKQWAVFYVDPENAILHIDSTQYYVRKGKAQAYLPLGDHQCMIEAPFHESWQGSIHLNDTLRHDEYVTLQPLYAYLTVRTPLEGCTILLNGKPIGHKKAVSDRLPAGTYSLTLVRNNVCFYNRQIEIHEAEKKVVDIKEEELRPLSIPRGMTFAQLAEVAETGTQQRGSLRTDSVKALVTITAPDSTTAILLDREVIGEGLWQGYVAQGFHAVNTRKDGLESATYYLFIDSSQAQTLNLAAPQSAYGMLNIASNVVDADIYINGKPAGTTPSVVQNLPADRNYLVKVSKKGYKDITETVYIRGNEMNHLHITLKKK